MNRRSVVLALTAALGLGALMAPAEAATRPAKVGLVTFTGATVGETTATLSMRWPKASYARSYEIFLSRSYAGVLDAGVHKEVSTTSTTLTGLAKGATYFVMVRGVNGTAKGTRSSRVGRTTIPVQGPGNGPSLSVLSWNLCSEDSKCGRSWAPREPGFQALVAKYDPSVLALQESISLTKNGTSAIPGYTRAAYYSSKALYLRSDVLRVVGRPATGTAAGALGKDCPAQAPGARYGCIALGGRTAAGAPKGTRFAVWAEVEHVPTGRRAIVTSAHLTSGKTSSADALRRTETTNLVRATAALNPEGLPVVHAGDFNSHRNRSNDTPGAVMRAAGIRDGFDLAETVGRQHYNSYNSWRSTPTLSVTYGDHVDHVWVDPRRAEVTYWGNVAAVTGARYTTPITSDHNPVLVRLSLD